jgi:uncharacterized protein
MFSIPSIGKILVFVAIIALVWFGFRLIGRLDKARQQTARKAAPERGKASSAVEETVRCPVCDAFVAARGATNCGRAGCPY